MAYPPPKGVWQRRRSSTAFECGFHRLMYFTGVSFGVATFAASLPDVLSVSFYEWICIRQLALTAAFCTFSAIYCGLP